jgi:hypothetical protein
MIPPLFGKQEVGIWRVKKTLPTIWGTYVKLVARIFLSNYWWQKSDILSQASYMYPISWEAFLDPSDSNFLLQTGSRNPTGPKTLPTIWYTYMTLVTKYQQLLRKISWTDEQPIRFLLPVCRLSWFLYTLNIYAHFSSHFSQQLLMAAIWYLVTSFI